MKRFDFKKIFSSGFIISLFFLIFISSFNVSFAEIGKACKQDINCGSGEVCDTSTKKCIVSATAKVEVKCAPSQFGVTLNGGTVCRDKIELDQTCSVDKENSKDNTCKSGYCDASSNKCANDPNCFSNRTKYQLTTGLPFLGLNKNQCIVVDTGMDFFLTGILRFILGSVGTITVIIIIVAGFMWSFSAGNKNTISRAQKMMTDAVIGLVMTLTSGLMLQVINPNLVKMGELFTKVSPKSINIMGIVEPTPKDAKGRIQPTYQCNTLVTDETKKYIQNQAPYRDVPYDNLKKNEQCYDKNDKGERFRETLSWAGCGPTSAAKVLKSLGVNVTPIDTAKYAGLNGFTYCAAGTDGGLFASIAKNYGLKYEYVTDKDTVKSILAKGEPVVSLMKGIGGDCKEYFAGGGHYIVASCLDTSNNAIRIDDPYLWGAGARTSAYFDNWFNCLKYGGVYYMHK